ncbi:MAG TPA: phage tail sheath C-terminal domain-containing protein [Bryobacteraceae bacterium]|nr:phage tail sheath C-terminal domain-containing protein [Bryobacteraceae bacterium]
MASFLHPGVFVREIPSGVRSIEGVPTSTAIFVGETERGPLEVTRISGRTEYTRLFGGYRRRLTGVADPGSGRLLLPYALDGFFSNGGTSAYILRLASGFDIVNPNTTATSGRDEPGAGVQAFLEASSPGAWGDSVSVAAALSTDSTAAADRLRLRLAVFYTPPGSTTAVLVEEFDRLSADPLDENYIVDALRRSAYVRWNGTVAPYIPADLDNDDILPRFPTAAELLPDAQPLTGGAGGDDLFTAASLPVFLTDRLLEIDDASLMVAASSRMLPEAATTADDFVAFENFFVQYVNNRPQLDLFFVGNMPSLADETNPITAAANYASGTGGVVPVNATTFNAVYWPHIEVLDPAGVGRNPTIFIPPSGYVAGLYAQTDGRRGVWKAPAGTEVRLGGVRSFEFEVVDVHQDTLNPRAVNALRRIPGAGLVVWGSRTMQPSSEWRYIPVRRTAIFLRQSIYRGIQWAVFEPNDQRLWQTLRNTITAFMDIQFRNGAFAGATSREAYFVKVDSETTRPEDQAAGIVNILVGFAPLRPAEFVVVSLQQMAGRTA